MSWTVACFCGTVFRAPPDRCPTCNAPLPDVGITPPTDRATRALAEEIDSAHLDELPSEVGERLRAHLRRRRQA